ncbi:MULTISPECIES: hypothetical protein [Acinetobacter]|jgi:hypothetical protein|uniref:Uncharacterized protein n=1 Tax=Acinetobacter schindleri CIP 107287 TaxID=1217988 RepID=N9AHZ4_9GAMM|nr:MULTISPECIES: hypothetical protein [Acinetobacter]ENV43315.1 hypothetical protein F955_02862 [Acinetobacter schindleri CIP 107287]
MQAKIYNRGSSIGGFLTLLLLIVVILWWGNGFVAISGENTTELTKAINEIDSPVFKESFTALVKRDMEDGKISNNEMYKLSEIYNGWEVAKSTGQEATYSKNLFDQVNPPPKTKEQIDSENKTFTIINSFILGFVLLLIIVIPMKMFRISSS